MAEFLVDEGLRAREELEREDGNKSARSGSGRAQARAAIGVAHVPPCGRSPCHAATPTRRPSGTTTRATSSTRRAHSFGSTLQPASAGPRRTATAATLRRAAPSPAAPPPHSNRLRSGAQSRPKVLTLRLERRRPLLRVSDTPPPPATDLPQTRVRPSPLTHAGAVSANRSHAEGAMAERVRVPRTPHRVTLAPACGIISGVGCYDGTTLAGGGPAEHRRDVRGAERPGVR